MKIAVVLLTWQRIPNLKATLSSLSRQTRKDFEVYISNANLERSRLVERYAYYARNDKKMRITVSHDGNDTFAFRRFAIGKKLAQQGFDVILFIDDDITIPNNYIEKMISQYEPKTYSSNFVWSFQDGGSDYYRKRTRHYDNKSTIHYCGTGVGMIDASIFLEEGIHNAPEPAIMIEDLWLSYYAQHVMGWKLKFVDAPGTIIKGTDKAALFRQVARSRVDKKEFLLMLINDYGWKL